MELHLESSVASLIPEHSLICANCSTSAPEIDPLSNNFVENTFIRCFDIPGSDDETKKLKSISVVQGLHLILKARRNPYPEPTKHKVELCSSCGELFGNILRMYNEFLSLSAKDSFVKKLIEFENYPPTMRAIKIQPNIPGPHNTTKLIRLVQICPEKMPPSNQRKPTPLQSSRTQPTAKSRTKRQPSIQTSAKPPVNKQKKLVPSVTKPELDSSLPPIIFSKPDITAQTHWNDVSHEQSLPCVVPTQTRMSWKERYKILQKPRIRRVRDGTSPISKIPEVVTLPSVKRPRKQKLAVLSDLEFSSESTHHFDIGGDHIAANVDTTKADSEAADSKTDQFGIELILSTGDFKYNCKSKSRKNKHGFQKAKRKKQIRKPMLYGDDQDLGVRQPLRPSRLPEEDQLLLKTTSYKCDVCEDPPQAFDTLKDWILHHEDIHHKDLKYGNVRNVEVVRPFSLHLRPCPRCGRKIRTNSLMLHHIKTNHLGQFSFSCEICQKKLSTKASLKGHMEICHPNPDNVQEYLCSLCAAKFRSKGCLISHEQTHLGLNVKKYTCGLCPAKFMSNYRLKDHKSTHSEERPFECDQCSQKFKTHRSLQGHIKLNHEKQVYDKFCEFCSRAFRSRFTLSDHLMRAHKLSKADAKKSAKMKEPIFRVLENGDRVFIEKPRKPKTCEFCGKTYARREGLFMHLITVHAKTEDESKKITGLDSKRDLIQKKVSRKSNRNQM